MSNIRSIVESAVPTEHLSTARPIVNEVVAALEEALSQSLTALAASARAAGVSQSDFEEALIDAGLAERPAPVAETPVEAPVGGDRISRMEEILNRLVAAAVAHGVRI